MAGILTDTITQQTSATVPEAALELQLDNKTFRYLFFNTVTDDTVNFQSNITDNYVENNTAIQDHIAISPVTITMRGLIGELVYNSEVAAKEFESALAQAEAQNSKDAILASFGDIYKLKDSGKLTAISAYLPEVSNVTQRAQNMWDLHEAAYKKASRIANILTGQANNSLSTKMNAYSGLNSNLTESQLKKICEEIKDYWINRKSFVAQTPFGDFDNMYIQSVTLHQGNENFIGEVDITLKQLRFAQSLTTEADQDVLAKYNAMARAEIENNGKAGDRKSSVAKEFTDKYLGTTPGSGIKR